VGEFVLLSLIESKEVVAITATGTVSESVQYREELMRHELLVLLRITLAALFVTVICSVCATGSTTKVLHSFELFPFGQNPYSNLITDSAGNLYGTTAFGGVHKQGTVFKMTPDGHGGWKETVLYSFKGGLDGFDPLGGLVFDSAGNLYGTTLDGGSKSDCCGTVFRLQPQGKAWTESVIYRFSGGADGGGPRSSLIIDSEGNLFGTTYGGGVYGQGTVFELTPSNGIWTENVLYSFAGGGGDGASPYAGVIFDGLGNLYGTTTKGGVIGVCGDLCDGTVFELTRSQNGWTETILYNFVANGQGPSYGSLVFDSDGNLYGTTTEGLVFELTPSGSGWTENYLWAMGGSYAGLIFDSAGNLYGTGSFPPGAVFELTPIQGGHWGGSYLYNFTGNADGGMPYDSLTIDASGHLYGTTSRSSPGNGTVFELAFSGGQWNESTLFNFPTNDGDEGQGNGLLLDSSGNLYGTNPYGGAYNQGSVFEMMPNGKGAWTERLIYSFQGGNDGAGPASSLIFDSMGNLYGTTSTGGGASACYTGCGTIFKLVPDRNGNWSESVLYAFAGGNDGIDPSGALVFDATGNLYGTTFAGGPSNAGTILQLKSQGGAWTESVIYTFTGGSDGANPASSLIFDTAGNLYGTTFLGGIVNSGCFNVGCGTIFELQPSKNGTWTESVLYEFTGGSDGANPVSSLIFDNSGNLYGTGRNGGILAAKCESNGCGVVFELSPSRGSGWTEHVLYSFTGGIDGDQPEASLVFDISGNLYGTASGGAKGQSYCEGGCGTVFKLTPGSKGIWTQTVLHNFKGPDGGWPTDIIIDGAGNLYGPALFGKYGDGEVFEITP
jgi:uncharacterized repeat protein (TIGR03803 family)